MLPASAEDMWSESGTEAAHADDGLTKKSPESTSQTSGEAGGEDESDDSDASGHLVMACSRNNG